MARIKVATARVNYPELRCICNEEFFDLINMENYDYYKYKNKILRLFGSKDEGYIFRDLLSSLHKQIDFYVTFNYIPITKKTGGWCSKLQYQGWIVLRIFTGFKMVK
ncbi:hypothetical protein GTPT_3212 [Tatumella ptyseos ATCC 33301]|uniref:Uncharacterized protein n=1 Tax=Tatumella ptyseos ATCC 33301 TaxID=1005995 RepID=A0A085JA79_9GAMM|nr:hypothetical protein GTPT_3212 [Tatumella ptyseos ATCC 33301]